MTQVITTLIRWMLAISFMVFSAAGHAGDAANGIAARSIDQRVQKLAEELRCLVCQNQTLADSHAELAVNLKQQIREKFQQGQNEKEITNFLVTRYGDFVHYRPPVNYQTLLLWTGPYFLLLAALIFVFARIKSAHRQNEKTETKTAEQYFPEPLL
ncbi:cytochrome c-type biogenesis protein [Undibacterium sp. TJN19]|uniref:cytochrome c-type biogenesis protein n=1 Tax=Undibacterium sp. TJN19 TaxID=3413055 RepID=UPI003BF1B85A